MTLLFTEGWETSAALDIAVYGKWFDAIRAQAGSIVSTTFQLTPGRYAGFGLRIASSVSFNSSATTQCTAALAANQTVVFVGLGFFDVATAAAAQNAFLSLLDSSLANQLELRISAAQLLQISRNGTVLGTSAAPYPQNAWRWLEMGCRISSTTGWAEVRVDNVPVIAYYGTGTSRATANGNTQGGLATGVRYVRLGGSISIGNTAATITGPNCSYDDFVVFNDQGVDNNDFLGDTQVAGLMPNGTGSLTQFIRAGSPPALTNWQSVDENPINGDVDYVASNVVSATDLYNYTALASAATIVRALSFQPVQRKDAAGQRTYRPYVRIPSTPAPIEGTIGADIVVGSSYGQVPTIAERKPDGTLWTTADIDTGEFGFRIMS